MSEKLFYEDEATSEVVRQISGQLRLSLGNIHSALQRLAPPETREEDDEIDQNAAVLCQSYYRVLRLTDNLAEASEPGRQPGLGQANGDIVALCRRVVTESEALADLLKIHLEFRCDRDSHIIAMDGKRVERLLLNLLSNAFKFIRKDQREVTLELRVERSLVLLVLADTGCGMTDEQLSTAFDRFQQLGRLEPPPCGLGLGLPICQRIAAEHGGSVALTSQPGVGTTATVSLANRKLPIRLSSSLPQILVPENGFNRTLVELADALPRKAFTQKHLD